ncbi:MAG TPA: beta-ketoacyl-ACP synthase I, partial [Oceanospirillaceae bacterium]|nr:beta-ketoacyl-ACP synthase I [Oceanospirillaceae bacterium]
MRRVVVTGIGIVSCLGKNKEEVLASLQQGKSGISYQPEYAEKGFKSHIAGSIDMDFSELIDRKLLRFMGESAAYSYLSMQEAIADAGLSDEQVSNVRTGLIAGSGGASAANIVEAADGMREKGLRRVGPYRV